MGSNQPPRRHSWVWQTAQVSSYTHGGTDKIAREWTAAFSIHTNVLKNMIPKMVDTSKDELLLGGGIRHLTATSRYHAHSEQVPAYISNIFTLNALIFRNISSGCAKEYLTAAMY